MRDLPGRKAQLKFLPWLHRSIATRRIALIRACAGIIFILAAKAFVLGYLRTTGEPPRDWSRIPGARYRVNGQVIVNTPPGGRVDGDEGVWIPMEHYLRIQNHRYLDDFSFQIILGASALLAVAVFLKSPGGSGGSP